MKSGIYRILNKINLKFYIGSAVNISHRWKTHVWNLNRNSHGNPKLQAAWNKYGEALFEFHVLEYCERSQLVKREQAWIDHTSAAELGYNVRFFAESNHGLKRSLETKEKQRLAMTGFQHSKASLEKMRIAQSNRSEETKRKLSASKMGHFVSEETKMKIGLSNRIKQHIKANALQMFKDMEHLYV